LRKNLVQLGGLILAIALLAGVACNPHQNPQEVKDRWNRDKPLNLNAATKEELMTLPGMTTAEADKVIAGRPYEDAGELVTRGILPKNHYDKIADRVTVHTWRGELFSAGAVPAYGIVTIHWSSLHALSCVARGTIQHSATQTADIGSNHVFSWKKPGY
jgi:Helix-hairpin-helix motif